MPDFTADRKAKVIAAIKAGTACPYCKCSYCEKRAQWGGYGVDGDSYCHDHKGRARGRVTPFDFQCFECGR